MLTNNKQLFMLPFDHRSSLAKKIFGKENLSSAEVQKFIEMKNIIYEGFKKALLAGVPKDSAAILVDEEFGNDILKDAKKQNINFALPVEKSGKDEFDFEFGDDFVSHIEKFQPTFVKALLRYNPEGNVIMNSRQRKKLIILSSWCKNNSYNFLLEMLIPATETQMASVDNEVTRFNNEIRPVLALKAINELQNANIKPIIWKIEGFDAPNDYNNTITEIKRNNSDSEMITLGRGENQMQVEKWLTAGKNIPGMIGFAIGRTIFQEAILEFFNNKVTANQAAEKICANYLYFYQIFNS